MKNLLIKDNLKRKQLKYYVIKRQCLKMIHHNESFSYQYRFNAFRILQYLKNIKFFTQYKNRCVLSNRSKGIEQKYKISRIMIRKLINTGLISQLYKASW